MAGVERNLGLAVKLYGAVRHLDQQQHILSAGMGVQVVTRMRAQQHNIWLRFVMFVEDNRILYPYYRLLADCVGQQSRQDIHGSRMKTANGRHLK